LIDVIISMYGLIGIGAKLNKSKWINKDFVNQLNKLVFNITLPAQLFVGIYDRLNIDLVTSNILVIMGLFTLVVSVLYINLFIFKRLLREELKAISSASLATFTNTLMFGLPACIAIFGEEAIIYVMMYYFCNSIPLWLIANNMFNSKVENKKTNIKNIVNPPIVSVILGILFVMSKLPMQKGIYDLLSYLSGVTTPLAMIIVGYRLYEYRRYIKFNRRILLTLLMKYSLLPVLVIIYVKIFIFKHSLLVLMAKVFIIESLLPTPTQFVVLVSKDEQEQMFASQMLILTFVISLVVIPATVYLLEILI